MIEAGCTKHGAALRLWPLHFTFLHNFPVAVWMLSFPKASIAGLLAGKKTPSCLGVSGFGGGARRIFRQGVQQAAFGSEAPDKKALLARPLALLQMDSICGVDAFLAGTGPESLCPNALARRERLLDLCKSGPSCKDDT